MNKQTKIPGILLSAAIAIPAFLIGSKIPVVGSPVLGILFGMLLALRKRSPVFERGIAYTSKTLLQYSVILLGFSLNLFNVLKVGRQTLILMLFTLTAAFVTAFLTGKLLKLPSNTKTLIGVGTAICGGSAIAATAPVINATDEEVAKSISTIFFFNVIAAFTFPFIGHLLGMSDQHFGLWAGTAINDTSSVVAAGYTFSNTAGDLAVIVKLTRTIMIVPITLVLAFYNTRKHKQKGVACYSIAKIFPWFVIGFVVASVISTFVPAPDRFYGFLSQAGKFMIVMAMASIGLNTNLVKLVKSGAKPLLLGLVCTVSLCLTSLAVQYFILRI